MSGFIDISPELARFVAACLQHGRQHLREQWHAAPRGAVELEQAMRNLHQASPSGIERQSPAPISDGWNGDDMAPLLLTYDDAAAVLAVSESTVRNLVRDGKLPAVSVGTARRIHRDDLEQYLDTLRASTRHDATVPAI